MWCNKELHHVTWSIGSPTYDLEYADDTLLISMTISQLENVLRTLEEQAELYGMHLNQTKTEILHDARKLPPTVRFKNGTSVPTTTQVKYLGTYNWGHLHNSNKGDYK